MLVVFLLHFFCYRGVSAESSSTFPWSIGDLKYSCQNLDDDWQPVGTSCIYSNKDVLLSWNSSQAYCTDPGRHYADASTIDNWLLARELRTIISPGLYWTGFVLVNNETMSVRSSYDSRTIYNPLWASGQPPLGNISSLCVALSVENADSFGWKLLNCTESLAVVCQTFACLSNEFRCLDNSRCIPLKAVHDSVSDCNDNSDEQWITNSKELKNEIIPINTNEQQLSHNIEGEINSLGVSNNTYTWELRSEDDKVLIITAENINLSPSAYLLIEDAQTKKVFFNFTTSQNAFSYVIPSSHIRIQFGKSLTTNDLSKFILKYYIRDKNPCLIVDDVIYYNSEEMPFDCQYNINSISEQYFIYLLADQSDYSSNSIVSITSSAKDTFIFASSNYSQSVILPAHSAVLSIRDAWKIGNSITKAKFRIYYIHQESPVIPFEGKALTLHWPASSFASPDFFHYFRLNVSLPDDYTWSVDRLRLAPGQDSVQLYVDSDVINLFSFTQTSFQGNAKSGSILEIIQKSTIFSISIKVSVDCPVLTTNALLSSTSKAFGSCVSLKCPEGFEIFGNFELQCLLAGEWSYDAAICKERTGECPVPIIYNGFLNSISSYNLTYGCQVGYSPATSESSAICSSSTSQWQPHPRCTAITCSTPEAHYKNAFLNATTGSGYGSRAYYYPLPNYFQSLAIRYCMSTKVKGEGEWVDHGFLFSQAVCQLPNIGFGSFGRTLLPFNESINPTCLDGFTSSITEICQNGTITQNVIDCKSKQYDSNVCGNGTFVPSIGGYFCDCLPGFQLAHGPSFTCIDTDECQYSYLNLCDPDAICVNTIGSYYCICPVGKQIWHGEVLSYEFSGSAGRSCIYVCYLGDIFSQGFQYAESLQPFYNITDQVNIYCLNKNGKETEVAIQSGATCTINGWVIDNFPCNSSCSFESTQFKGNNFKIGFLNDQELSCSSKKQIGNGLATCLWNNVLHTVPICVDYVCPNLTRLSAQGDWTYTVQNPKDKDNPFVLHSVLEIHFNDKNCKTKVITCSLDKQNVPVWVGDVDCEIKHKANLEIVDLLEDTNNWDHSADWLLDMTSNIFSVRNAMDKSFLSSLPISLKSDTLQIMVNVTELQGNLNIYYLTASDYNNFPFYSYQKIGTTSEVGQLVINLSKLSKYLRIFLQPSGSIDISSIAIVYTYCPEMKTSIVNLPLNYLSSSYQPLTFFCSETNIGSISAICTLDGWLVSDTCGKHNAETVFEQIQINVTLCSLNTCSWGTCIDITSTTFYCECYPNFYWDPPTQRCIPDDKKYSFCSSFGTNRQLSDGSCECKTGYQNSLFPSCVYPNDENSSSQVDCNADSSKNQSCISILRRNEDTILRSCVHRNGHLLVPCNSNEPSPFSPPPFPSPSPSPSPNSDECHCDHGQCINGICFCQQGFIGLTCAVSTSCVNDVVSSGTHCKNGGTCNPGNGTCNCLSEFMGETCENLSNFCDGITCNNRGTCLNYLHGYFCKCDIGYSGSDCEMEIDTVCAENNQPCQYGSCLLNNTGSWSCECDKGYSGELCDIPQPTCTPDLCDHGTCIDLPKGDYACSCARNYRLDSFGRCSELVKYCDFNPCLNGGTCTELYAEGYECQCPPGTTGTDCDVNECDVYNCQNNGTCSLNDQQQPYCSCPPLFTGKYCETDFNPCIGFTCVHGSCSFTNNTPVCTCYNGYTGESCELTKISCDETICQNNGECINQSNGSIYCLCVVGFTGQYCETGISSSYNLVFNSFKSSQSIVSRMLNTSLYREFTLCSWVQYAPSKYTASSQLLPPFLSIATNTKPIQIPIKIDNMGVWYDNERLIMQSISNLVWHQICLRSPEYNSDGKPIWSYFVDGNPVESKNNLLPESKEFQYLIMLDPDTTFEGIISLVQLYSSRLADEEIAEMTYDCMKWNSGHPDLIINWPNFTTVQRDNAGIKMVVPGICATSNCLPGRSGCNDTDKIPPIVVECPSSIRKISSERLTSVEWPISNMFYDNVGVTAVTSNFRSGQLFTWGIYHVVYVASDQAGNTATCEFDLSVAPMDCRETDDTQVQGSVLKQNINGTDSHLAAFVKCSDEFYQSSNPSFFTCDSMGQWERDNWKSPSSKYSFPSCGTTVVPDQSINGTLDVDGECEEVFDDLYNTLYGDISSYCTNNCTNQINIEPKCNASSVKRRDVRQVGKQFFVYQINLNTTRKMLSGTVDRSVKQKFPNASTTISALFNCSSSHPLSSILGNTYSCANCPPGTFWRINVMDCADCPIDTFRNSSSTKMDQCDKCPNGLTTGMTTRATSIDQCYTKCPIGSYYANKTLGCIHCPFGSYQPNEGSNACITCKLYTSTTITGATSETDCSAYCSPGYQFDSDGVTCVPCPISTYKNVTIGPCQTCPLGLTTSSDASKYLADCNVIWCPPNTQISASAPSPVSSTTFFAAICNLCGQGTYQPKYNQTECFDCPSVDTAPTCKITSSCSPQLSTTCGVSSICQARSGYSNIYSCAPLVEPAKKSNSISIGLIVGIGSFLLVLAAGIVLYFYRDRIPCLKIFLKQRPPERNIYRSPHRTFHARANLTVPSTISTIENEKMENYENNQKDMSSQECISSRPVHSRVRLPPPIITSKFILDQMEKDYNARNIHLDSFDLGQSDMNINRTSDSFLRSGTTGMQAPESFSSLSSHLADDYDDDFFG